MQTTLRSGPGDCQPARVAEPRRARPIRARLDPRDDVVRDEGVVRRDAHPVRGALEASGRERVIERRGVAALPRGPGRRRVVAAGEGTPEPPAPHDDPARAPNPPPAPPL